MRTIAVANHKGGVGKTASAHALGVAMSRAGYQVLLVDIDPQASLTQACGIHDAGGRSLAEVLGDSQPGRLSLADIIQPIADNLHLAPANIALSRSELGLATREGRESLLKNALQLVARRYDLVLIDCPPALGLLTVCALVASAGVLIPTQPQAADMRGLALFIDTLQLVRTELNPELETLGVLVTFLDLRLVHHRQAIETMQNAGLPLLPVMIGRSVRIAEAAGAGESVLSYDPHNPQALAYNQLSEVIKSWLEKNNRI